MMNFLRKLLYPVVPIYYIVTWFRNLLYDLGVKKTEMYDFPVIAVGNLSVGGTGKSPMVEYLIRILQSKFTVATLSRGYGRKTKGFLIVNEQMTASEVGDEPLQFKTKFNNVTVAVDANRRNGIQKLYSQTKKLDVILLDDAFQHRKVTAGLYVLLTAYHDLYVDDIMLPTGNLREPRSGAKRAQVIIVTKCPKDISISDRKSIANKLDVDKEQQLYFATIGYNDILLNDDDKTKQINCLRDVHFTLVTGIANPAPLVSYYKSLSLNFEHLEFPDHHLFTEKEKTVLQAKDLIITTEKDHTRMKEFVPKEKLWYQPIEMSFLDNRQSFDHCITDFVETNL